MGPSALRGIQATGDTLSNVESQVFTPYNLGSSRDRTPDLLTTRPTCYHSATALFYVDVDGLYFVGVSACLVGRAPCVLSSLPTVMEFTAVPQVPCVFPWLEVATRVTAPSAWLVSTVLSVSYLI